MPAEQHQQNLSELRRTAEQGYAVAQYSLGDTYNRGRGVPCDYEEAVTWYRKAADQGNANAQHSLGRMLLQGSVVPIDDAEAVNWHRMAADQGKAKARALLRNTPSPEEMALGLTRSTGITAFAFLVGALLAVMLKVAGAIPEDRGMSPRGFNAWLLAS